MKVNVEIDCTPLEARQFFGLPDVQPMQNAVMDKLQQQMISNIDKVSPEALIQSWFTFDPKSLEVSISRCRPHSGARRFAATAGRPNSDEHTATTAPSSRIPWRGP